VTKRTTVVATAIIGTLCLIAVATVALTQFLNTKLTDPGPARARTAARSRAHQIQQEFDKIARPSDPRTQIPAATRLVAGFNLGNADVTYVFQTQAQTQSASVSFALDAYAEGKTIFGDITDNFVRLCLQLSWTSDPTQPSQLRDTTCPANLQANAQGPLPRVNGIIRLAG
jgi:hypothetical protein